MLFWHSFAYCVRTAHATKQIVSKCKLVAYQVTKDKMIACSSKGGGICMHFTNTVFDCSGHWQNDNSDEHLHIFIVHAILFRFEFSSINNLNLGWKKSGDFGFSKLTLFNQGRCSYKSHSQNFASTGKLPTTETILNFKQLKMSLLPQK